MVRCNRSNDAYDGVMDTDPMTASAIALAGMGRGANGGEHHERGTHRAILRRWRSAS